MGGGAPTGGAPSLWDFSEGDLVWARQRACPWWPAEIVPGGRAPPAVRRLGRPDQVCVMYLGHKGPPAARRRFYGWVGRGAVLPYEEHVGRFRGQKLKKGDRPAQFAEALEEARLWEPRGACSSGPSSSLGGAPERPGPSPGPGPEAGPGPGPEAGAGRGAGPPGGGAGSCGPGCSKCGQALVGGVGFSFQGRVGLCRPCQRSFQSGCFCPVCDQAYSPTAKDMVCCDACGCWVHSHCDQHAQEVLRDDREGRQRGYSCPGCRGADQAAAPAAAADGGAGQAPGSPGGAAAAGLEGPVPPGNGAAGASPAGKAAGAGNGAAAVGATPPAPRLGLPPSPPPGAADPLALPGGGGEDPLDLLDFDIPADLEMVPAPLLRQGSGHDFGEAPGPSAGPPPRDGLRLRRERRERRRRERQERRECKKQVRRYAKSCFANDFLPGYILSHKKASRAELEEIVLSHWRALDDTLHRYYYKIARDAVVTKSVPEWAAATARSCSGGGAGKPLPKKAKGIHAKGRKKGAGKPGKKRKLADGLGGAPGPDRKKTAQPKVFVQGGASLAAAIRDAKPPLPAEVSVICAQSYRGNFYVHDLKVLCMSDCCVGRPEEERTFTPVRWEAHCGAGSAKKWKSTIRLEPGTVPELPTGSVPKPIGRWLEQRGVVQGKPTLAIREATPEPEEDLPPWMGPRSRSFEPVKAVWALDRCAVCDMDVDYDNDQFVSCDSCGITVHQSCYGVKEAPDIDDMWLCRACELREAGDPAPQCCLCPVQGGALKPTTLPGVWCHVACMQWTPEVTVVDVDRMEPIANIKSVQTERWELTCSICKQSMGAGIQCTECFTAYHPLCARMAGYYMEIREAGGKRAGAALDYVSYCDKHRKPQPGETGLSRPGAVGRATQLKTNAVADLSAYILHARLPHFAPENAQGCARCVPQDVGRVRDTKGAGSGIGSVKGFWIPEAPLPAEKVPAPAAVPPPPGLLQRFRGATGVGLCRPAVQRNTDERDASEERRQPPPAVELLPLPEGCPESLQIQCNGKRGVLNVRTQQVVHEGEEMTATRFEQFCGRLSKRWKTSLCVDLPGDADASEPVTVAEWLASHGLDHRLLTRLTDNVAKLKAFARWEEETIELGVRSALDDALLRTFGNLASGHPPTAALHDADDLGPRSSGGRSGAGGAKTGDSSSDTGRAMQPASDDVQAAAPRPMDGSSDAPVARERPGSNRCGYCATCRNKKSKKGCLTAKRERALKEDLAKEERPAPAGEGGGQEARPPCEPQALPPGFRLLDVGKFGHECVGRRLSVFWDVDDTWYRGSVAAYDEHSGKHRIVYADGEEEDLFLAAETWEFDRECEDQAKPRSSAAPAAEGGEPPPPPVKTEWGELGPSGECEAGPEVRDALPRAVPEVPAAFPAPPRERLLSGEPSGQDCVGWRVGIWWVDDKCFYRAVVTGYDPDLDLHSVWYDDDVKEELLLKAESVQWLAGPGAFRPPRSEPKEEEEEEEQKPQPEAGVQQDPKPDAADGATPAALPEELPVVCNGLTATFLPATQKVRLDDRSMVPPRQFEKLAGRNQAKKWKASIRVRKKDGAPGRTLGDWFVEMGLDAPKPPKPKGEGGAGGAAAPGKGGGFRRTTQRPKQGSGTGNGAGAGGPLSGHRPGCLCVVCKNKRRLGLPAPAPGGAGGAASPVAPDTPRGRPTPPMGKRAFVEGVYQNPGLTRQHVSRLPLSRMWTGAEWMADQEKKFKVREDESAAVRARDAEVQALAAALKAEAVAQEALKREAAAVAAAERKLAALAALEATADLVSKHGAAAASKRNAPPARQQPAVLPTGLEAVGWRVGVWWEDDACFYYGELKGILSGPPEDAGAGAELGASPGGGESKEPSRYAIKYDDGHAEEVVPSQERMDWVARADSDVGVLHRIGAANGDPAHAPAPALPGQPRQRQASAAPQGADAEGWRIAVRWDEDRTYYFAVVEAYDPQETPRAYRVHYDDGESEWLDLGRERLKWIAPAGYFTRPDGQVPATVKVVCGTLEGLFQVHNRRVEVAGEAVTPMAFEKLGGRENAKKWKTSLRVVGPDGRPGKNIGDWLIAMGVEMPRGKLAKAAAAPVPPETAEEEPSQPPSPPSAAPGCGEADGVPGGASGADEAAPPTDGPPDAARPDDGGRGEQARAGAQSPPPEQPAARQAGEDGGEPPRGPAVGAEPERGAASPPAATEPARLERRAVSMAEKLRACERTEGERILFGKSGIHGWGLFARRDLEQGEFLVEYRGDRIRPHVANDREAQYRREGKDMYLFSLSDEWIVDATDCGSVARFVNHSCAPSVMSKIVDVDGLPHLVFVARCAVQAGQELTYDYRLAKEDDGEKLPCLCGAPTCRGTLN